MRTFLSSQTRPWTRWWRTYLLLSHPQLQPYSSYSQVFPRQAAPLQSLLSDWNVTTPTLCVQFTIRHTDISMTSLGCLMSAAWLAPPPTWVRAGSFAVNLNWIPGWNVVEKCFTIKSGFSCSRGFCVFKCMCRHRKTLSHNWFYYFPTHSSGGAGSLCRLYGGR